MKLTQRSERDRQHRLLTTLLEHQDPAVPEAIGVNDDFPFPYLSLVFWFLATKGS